MDIDELLAKIDATRPVEHRVDGVWAVWPGVDVRQMAVVMLAAGTHFSTLTCVPTSDDALRVIYHWAVDGRLVNIETAAVDGQLPTIGDLVPAADWAEREAHDYFAIEFTGRAETPPLVLRDGDEPGLFSRTQNVGRDENPAQVARAANASQKGEPR